MPRPFRLTRPRVPEAAVQAGIVAALSFCGYTVLVTGAYRKRAKCPKCLHWFFPHTPNGSQPGVPDVLYTRRAWGGFWATAEIKGEGTRVRPEQQTLAAAGLIVIVRSVSEALSAAAAAEERLGLTNGRIADFLRANRGAKL